MMNSHDKLCKERRLTLIRVAILLVYREKEGFRMCYPNTREWYVAPGVHGDHDILFSPMYRRLGAWRHPR